MVDRDPQSEHAEAKTSVDRARAPSSSAWHQEGLQQRQLRRLRRQAHSPLGFPRWSLALALLIALLAAAAITAAVIALRDDSVPMATAPIIRVTAASGYGDAADQGAPSESTDTPAQGVVIVIAAEPTANLQIDGPVLPTVVITLTPLPLTVGAVVRGGRRRRSTTQRPQHRQLDKQHSLVSRAGRHVVRCDRRPAAG